MHIPKTKAAWKRLQPTNLKQAMRYCKEYARTFRRLTVPAIAELMGESEDALYKWLATGRMPATMVPVYEHICGVDYVTQYLAYRNHKLIIDIPTGRSASEMDVAELQQLAAGALLMLVQHYKSGRGMEETSQALTQLMGGLAWHRENISVQPELDFAGGGE